MAEFVTVCCKLPGGLILELDEIHRDQPTIGSTGLADVWRPSGRKVVITGSLANHPSSPNHGRVIGGYGLTEVDKDFWDEWVVQHKGYPWLVNGSLFAQPSPDRATSQAKEQAEIKTGFEPMDPNKPGTLLSLADTQ